MGGKELMFPISRDPPEGGTQTSLQRTLGPTGWCFQFLGIPPKGEHETTIREALRMTFPISRDPPEGGTGRERTRTWRLRWFPISRDPPEGGT